MINHAIISDKSILTIRPRSPLTAFDFAGLSAEVDPYIDRHGGLSGILLEADEFKGWENFRALLAHFKFVRDHHRSVRRVATVGDSELSKIAPDIASHFVKAEVRHFSASQRAEAMRWLSE